MKLSPDDKAERERQRLLDKAREYSAGTYLRKFVAPLFQRMIRAEAGAQPDGLTAACTPGGTIENIYRCVGQCVCVTCGKVDSWDSGITGLHTGHFASSRRNSILLLDENCAPQCQSCNYYRSGLPAEFRLWMTATRGIEVIERIESLKRTSVSFTREQLVDMRLTYKARLDAAIATMKTRCT